MVEDELAIREATRRLLARSGYHVHTAADGAEALALLASGEVSVDLVLADVVMPTMGGPQLLTALRRQNVTVPFVFMSGHTERVHGEPLDPSVPLLTKPWRTGDLLAALRERLEAV